MPIRSRNRSDLKRRHTVMTEEIRKRLFVALLQDQTLSTNIREYFQAKIIRISRNASQIRIRNRCIWTGRSRGILKRFRCSRIVFRDLNGQGRIMGIRKASW